MDYADKHLSDLHFFEAETFFSSFENSGNQDYLSLEETLADYSDCILILVESPGAQAELGAFTVKDKLAQIVLAVNRKEFEGSKSFITKGPIAKIDKVSKFKPTVYADFDSILRCMPTIEDRLGKIRRQRGESVNLKDFEAFTANSAKIRLLFLIDLISIFSPVKHSELVSILKSLYGEHSFRITKETAFLDSLDLLSKYDGYLMSHVEDNSLFLRYRRFKVEDVRSTVVRSYFKKDRKRLQKLKARVRTDDSR